MYQSPLEWVFLIATVVGVILTALVAVIVYLVVALTVSYHPETPSQNFTVLGISVVGVLVVISLFIMRSVDPPLSKIAALIALTMCLSLFVAAYLAAVTNFWGDQFFALLALIGVCILPLALEPFFKKGEN